MLIRSPLSNTLGIHVYLSYICFLDFYGRLYILPYYLKLTCKSDIATKPLW